MQKKTDKLIDKFVKKNYNNELEKILEKKYYQENVKSLLLSILYKIDIAYKDYEKIKQDVETKEEFIEKIIENVRKNCDEIKIVNLNSKESKMLGKNTFLVEKEKKRIICYPIERKLLYCISKISKNDKIVKDEYYLFNKTISDLLNIGNNIDKVESMRDFNGYSWTTLSREIESISHNLIYQNLRIIVGNIFLNNWIENKEFIIDYMELLENKLEENYEKEVSKELLENIKILSILLSIEFDKKFREDLKKEKNKIDSNLEEIIDNKVFVQKISKKKRELSKEIKQIDETVNNKELLQEEYIKRNENLLLEEKIFSIRILSKLMNEERLIKIAELEELNNILNPQKFVDYKKELEEKSNYLKLVKIEDLSREIKKYVIKIQKDFLKCFKMNVMKVQNKQEITKIIYMYRYYNLLPFDEGKCIFEVKELKNQLEEVEKLIIKKANDLKFVEIISKNEELNYKLLKNIFKVRVINLESIYIKIINEGDKYYLQLFDDEIFENKIEIENTENLNKKNLEIKLNKKIKIFN